MSRIRIVEGAINKTTKGEHSIYSDGNINVVSNRKASFQGDNGGIKMGSDPQEAPELGNTTGIICKVDVRPSSDWKGQGYGFDWMRVGDYKEVLSKAGADTTYADGDQPYRELISRQFSELPPEATPDNPGMNIGDDKLITSINTFNGYYYQDKKALAILQKLETEEYKRCYISQIPQYYYCPWLSIYPDKEIKLSLLIDIHSERTETTRNFELDFNQKEYLDIQVLRPEELLKLQKNESGQPQAFPDILSVKCLKPFDRDLLVNIYLKGTPAIVGKLQVYANSAKQQRAIKVIPVRLTSMSDPNLINIRKLLLNANEYLEQAYIQCVDIKQYTNKDSYIDLQVYHNQNYGSYLFHPPAEMTDPFYNYVVKNDNPNPDDDPSYLVVFCSKKKNYNLLPADKIDLVTYLNRLVKEEMNQYGINADEYVKVYIADQELYTKTVNYNQDETNTEVYYSGFAGGYIHGEQALFYGPDVIGSSLAHELLHAIGLEHSFSTYHKTEIRSTTGKLIHSSEDCKMLFILIRHSKQTILWTIPIAAMPLLTIFVWEISVCI